MLQASHSNLELNSASSKLALLAGSAVVQIGVLMRLQPTRLLKNLSAVIPGRARQRVYARLRRAMGANPESRVRGIGDSSGFRIAASRRPE